MSARRLRAATLILLQSSNAEAAPTSSPLLHQHQLQSRRRVVVVAVVVTSPSLMHARRACVRNVNEEKGSSSQAASCRSLRQHSPGLHASFAVFQQPLAVVIIKPSQHRCCCTYQSQTSQGHSHQFKFKLIQSSPFTLDAASSSVAASSSPLHICSTSSSQCLPQALVASIVFGLFCFRWKLTKLLLVF